MTRCIGIGSSREEVIENMIEAIQFYLEGLKEEGLPIPPPNVESENLVSKI